MYHDSRRLLIAAVALLCLFQAVVGGVAVAASANEGSAQPVAQSIQTTPTNNTSVQQENPDELDETGDTEAVRSFLAQSLAEQLENGAIRISQDEYEQGRGLLGDEYDSTLEKYVDVAGEADSDETTAFEQAAESQRELGETARTYNETYQAYQQAVAEGNETHARELARELERLATETNESTRKALDSYREIENSTGANLSDAEQAVLNSSTQIYRRQQAVLEATFIETSLSVGSATGTVSFADPARVDGELTLENGTGLANESVTILIGDRIETVQTDRDGGFTLDYRPVTVQSGNESLRVAYRPDSESPYLGSNATLPITVTQTTATLTIDNRTTSAGFGDEVTVSGRAHVDGTAVDGARVRVRVGGVSLGTATTGSDGGFQVAADLPASVASGNRTIEAVIVPPERAVRSETATTSLRVESTETALSVEATRDGNSQVRITGQLATVDGASVPGQTVELRINGTTVATVETGSSGSFARLVSLESPQSGTITVRAVYDARSSNLAGSTAETVVDLDDRRGENGDDDGNRNESSFALNPFGGGGENEENGLGPLSLPLLVGGGTVVVVVLAIRWLARLDRSSPDAGQTVTSPPDESSTEESGPSMTTHAATLLDDGDTEAAIRALYSTVRDSMRGGNDSQTHWEFYATASDRLNPGAAGSLQRLTEAYERAVYSPRSVDAGTVDELIDGTERLLDRRNDDTRE